MRGSWGARKMADPEIRIEVREALVVAVDPDGTETVLGTYERLVRMALGEFRED